MFAEFSPSEMERIQIKVLDRIDERAGYLIDSIWWMQNLDSKFKSPELRGIVGFLEGDSSKVIIISKCLDTYLWKMSAGVFRTLNT